MGTAVAEQSARYLSYTPAELRFLADVLEKHAAEAMEAVAAYRARADDIERQR